MKLLAFILTALFTFTAFGATTADAEKVTFRAVESQADTVNVHVQAIEALKEMLKPDSEGYTTLIQQYPESESWSLLRKLVAENPDVPSRTKVLEILDNKYSSPEIRKYHLVAADNGVPYAWIMDNLFRGVDDSGIVINNENSKNYIQEQLNPRPAETETKVQPAENTIPAEIKHTPAGQRFALKTNFLYYFALMPNVELEWMFHRRWSVSLDANVAWYGKESHVYQLAMFSPEVRYWVHERKPWHGLYVGAFAGAGLYDLENGGTGYKGEGYMGGISVGYMWPISKYISLETELGAGYMQARYEEYEPKDGHYLYQREKTLNYFGPLKLKFSLVWRFGAKSKPKVNPAL